MVVISHLPEDLQDWNMVIKKDATGTKLYAVTQMEASCNIGFSRGFHCLEIDEANELYLRLGILNLNTV